MNDGLKATLRRARGLATELRNVLEEAETQLHEDSGLKSTALTELEGDINEQIANAGDVEDWLDKLKINEDGTSAEDGFGHE